MKHKIALIGAGNISRSHLRGWRAHPDRVELVAACDPDPDRLTWLREEHGVDTGVSSVGELIGVGGWDVAVVCTPSHVRAPAVLELAAAGKHVLVEKPLSWDYAEAQTMIEACVAGGVQLAVNQNFRDQYAFGLGRTLITDGAVGEVLAIFHQELQFRQDQGWRLQQPRHALSVMGIHWFDGFRVLTGAEASWISARAWSAPTIEAVGETDAHVQLIIGDVPVTYVQSFSSPLRRTETVVFGATGQLVLGYDQVALHRGTEDVQVHANPYSSDQPSTMFRSLDRLLTAVEEGGEPSNSGRDNLRTVALLDAAYRSADAGAPVTLTEGLPG